MFRGSGKPFTAVSVQIDRLTSEQFEEDDIAGVFDLVEVIRIQASGPTEAARALRKKLKYGNPHRQLRALVLLNALIENAGSRFQRTFADEPLLERLRLLPHDQVTDAAVRKKCQVLFVQWADSYKNTAGLERIANLYKELPKTQRPAQARQKVLQDTERDDSDGEPPSSSSGTRSRATSSATPASRSSTPVTLSSTAYSHSSSGFSKLSKKSKSGQGKPFNLAREKDNMTTTIAQASIASTNLLNGLQLINRETQRVSENQEVVRRFETCKNLRRKILYYIQHVESDDWIGSLVNANDELVKALTAYEITDRSIDDDSDSDAWEHSGTSTPNPPPVHNMESNTKHLAGLKMDEEQPPAKPPRPGGISMPPKPSFPQANSGAQEGPDDGEDDNDPFGDANAAPTPYHERPGMTWKEVLKWPDVVVGAREVEKESDGEEENALQRFHSQQPSPTTVVDEKDQLPRDLRAGGPEKGKPAKLQNKTLRKKSKKQPTEAQAKQEPPESDLQLVRTPATNQLPRPPSEEEQRAIAYDRMIQTQYRGVEPRMFRWKRMEPDYAEHYTSFKDPKFGEPNPSMGIRIKRRLADTLIAAVHPVDSVCRFGRFLAEEFCSCCMVVDKPRIFVRKPSNEDEPNRFGRASVSHETPQGSMQRSRKNLAHQKTQHGINQSRQLLKPPKPTTPRDCEDREDPREVDNDRPSAIPGYGNEDTRLSEPSGHEDAKPTDCIDVDGSPHLVSRRESDESAFDSECPVSPKTSYDKCVRFPGDYRDEDQPLEMWRDFDGRAVAEDEVGDEDGADEKGAAVCSPPSPPPRVEVDTQDFWERLALELSV